MRSFIWSIYPPKQVYDWSHLTFLGYLVSILCQQMCSCGTEICMLLFTIPHDFSDAMSWKMKKKKREKYSLKSLTHCSCHRSCTLFPWQQENRRTHEDKSLSSIIYHCMSPPLHFISHMHMPSYRQPRIADSTHLCRTHISLIISVIFSLLVSLVHMVGEKHNYVTLMCKRVKVNYHLIFVPFTCGSWSPWVMLNLAYREETISVTSCHVFALKLHRKSAENALS